MQLKKSDSVKVKQAISVEGFENIDFIGWQGWVTEIFESDDANGETEVNVAWDSITIQNLPEEYIMKNIEDDFDFDSMILAVSVLEKASKRDKISDRISLINDIKSDIDFFGGFDDKEDIFYEELFESKDIEVNPKNLRKYLAYIEENIEQPCILTGIESMGTFSWEEPFSFGYGSKTEYNNLRKTHPSYKDEYELLSFIKKDIDKYIAIRVKVLRLSDKKEFIIGLDELLPVDKKSENFAILNPFVDWYVNY